MENFDYKAQKNKDFYNEKDDDDYIHLVHVTRGDPKSILTNGLMSGNDKRNPKNSDKNYGSSAGYENSFVWTDHASNPHHFGGPRVLLKLPKSKYRIEKLNDYEYGVAGTIDPEDIYGIDYQMPFGGHNYISEIAPMIEEEMKDYYATDDGKENLSYVRKRSRDEYPNNSYISFDDFMRMTPFLNWDEDDIPELFGRDLKKK